MCDAPIVDPTYVWLVNVWLVMRELEKKKGGERGFRFLFCSFFSPNLELFLKGGQPRVKIRTQCSLLGLVDQGERYGPPGQRKQLGEREAMVPTADGVLHR